MTARRILASTALAGALLTGWIAVWIGSATTALADEPGKGKLAKLKDQVIELEVGHRKAVSKLQDELDAARESGDSSKIEAAEKKLEKQRARFRDQARKLMQELRGKVVGAGFEKMVQEKKSARQKLDTTLRKLRTDLNEARKNNDSQEVAKVKKRIANVEKEFADRIRKALDSLEPKD